MQRLRETLAHGGIAILAVVFAVALTLFNLALALSQEIVSVIQQQSSEDGDGWTLDFTVGETTISYASFVYYGIALVLIALALYGATFLTQRTAQTCPECRSHVPADASVCRYCTADLAPPAADA